MNAITRVDRYNQTVYLYSNDVTTNIATITKQDKIVMRVMIDYSQLTVPIINIINYTFNVNLGSNPPLAITSAKVNSDGVLDFLLSGGIEGTEYIVTVIVQGSAARTDKIIIRVPIEECGCGATVPPAGVSNGAVYPVGEGQVFINSAPKYIVSTRQPTGVNLMDQWYNPAINALYEYITDGTHYWWQELVITAPPMPGTFNTLRLQPIVGDNVTTQFQLNSFASGAVDILYSTDLLVSVDGVWQEPEIQYVAWSDQINFAEPPSVDSRIFMIWFIH